MNVPDIGEIFTVSRGNCRNGKTLERPSADGGTIQPPTGPNGRDELGLGSTAEAIEAILDEFRKRPPVRGNDRCSAEHCLNCHISKGFQVERWHEYCFRTPQQLRLVDSTHAMENRLKGHPGCLCDFAGNAHALVHGVPPKIKKSLAFFLRHAERIVIGVHEMGYDRVEKPVFPRFRLSGIDEGLMRIRGEDTVVGPTGPVAKHWFEDWKAMRDGGQIALGNSIDGGHPFGRAIVADVFLQCFVKSFCISEMPMISEGPFAGRLAKFHHGAVVAGWQRRAGQTIVRIVDAQQFRQLAEVPAVEELGVFRVASQIQRQTRMT